jgi:hypothetical protein
MIQELTMSCKIERVVSDEHVVVLLISGRITGEEVDLLRRVLDQEARGCLTVLGIATWDHAVGFNWTEAVPQGCL